MELPLLYIIQDTVLQQSDLNRLVCRSESLGLTLNMKKCPSIVYKKSITVNYYINGPFASSVENSVQDLDFGLSIILNPRLYVKEICCNKALKIQGFIFKIFRDLFF